MPITLDDIVLSVVAALIGLAVTLPVTYLVIDRIIERNEKKRMKPIEITAKSRLSSKLGLGSLTTILITLAIDVRASADEERALTRDVVELYISKLKSMQSDLEMLLGIYNDVLSVEVEEATSKVIAQIEHLEEDLQYVLELHPRHATEVQVDHIEHVILVTVQATRKELEALGAVSEQVKALEEWLLQQTAKHVHPEPEEPVEVSGKHRVT